MTAGEIIKTLNADVHCGHDRMDISVNAACGSDLMSDVIAFVKDAVVLLTGLTTIQTIRTAIIMDIPMIVLVRGKKPSADMVALAAENGIVLASTNLPMFLACGRLYGAGLVNGGTRPIGGEH